MLKLILSISVIHTFVMGSINNVYAQENIKVSGVVKGSDSDEGLPGVTIFVKGTTNGTTSDIDGQFSLNIKEDAILVFSFIGYKTFETALNGRSIVNPILELDTETLDEVVIIGYGEQKKANLTGAVVTVDAKELEELSTGNLAQGLIGKLAGVQVSQNGTGIPGTASPLVIRAESASSLQRQVLYVIDGVVYSDNDFYAVPGPSGSEVFNRLDPSEIESISILKDGAAAVYGARAAGGVVLVKTKRGQAGKLKFTYNGASGIGQPTQIPDMLTGLQHAELFNEILDVQKSTGQRVNNNDYFTEDELAEIAKRDYNWLEGLYKTAYNQRHAMTMSGGSQDVKYFLAGSYYKETGNYDNLWYKRYSIRSNIDYDVTKNLKFGFGINFSQGDRKNPNYDPGSGNTGEGVLRDWYKRPLTASRWVPPTVNGDPVYNGSWNPYGLLKSDNYKTSTNDNTNFSAKIDYKVPFLDGLKLNGLLSYNINTSSGTRYGQDYPATRYFKDKGIGAGDSSTVNYGNSEGLYESFEKGNVYQFNLGANYSKTFGNHNLSAILVYEQQDGNTRGFSAQKNVADIRGFDYFWAFQNAGNTIGYSYNQGGRWSTIGRLNYDFKGKYLLESSFRAESSNKFSPANRFGIFPSASIGWVLSEESFIKDNVSFINFLKVRSSLGLTGNDGNSSASEWKPTFSAGQTGAIFGTSEVQTNAISANNNGFFVPSRTWAKSRSFNVGMDIAVLNQKLKLTSEYYYNLIYDAFDRPQNVPFVVGNPKPPQVNHKESFSKGYEFQTSYSDNVGKDMNFSIYGNFTKRRSRPLKLYQNPIVLGTWVDELKNDDSNQPGFVALGIIRDEQQLEEVKKMYPGNLNADGDVVINGLVLAPGMIYYKDLGGPNYSRVPDGKLDGNDRKIIAKYTTAPYSYGFGFTLGWKAWKLNTAFGGQFGHKAFIQKDEQVVDTNSNLVATQTQNTFAWWGDYWTEENQDASMPRPAKYGLDGEVSTFWMRNGHTLRLNNISLSYTMPEKIAKKVGMSNLKFYSSATNLWTIISPFNFKDPAVSRAFDYPLVRMVNLGLSFSI